MSAPAAKSPRIVLAPFGRHTAYILAFYLRHVMIVLSILLAIALTIDLWPQFQSVAAHGHDTVSAIWNVVRYSALRTPGLLAPLVPFATFIGVVWTEVAHTQSGERMLVWNSGRSPLQCLTPVLLAGAILGAADFAMDGWLGPASMHIQIAERLGRDGTGLDRSKWSRPVWIALGGDILRTRIEFRDPPVLRDVVMFKRGGDGRLSEVYVAPEARLQSGDAHTGDDWVLLHGQSWRGRGPVDLSRTLLPGRSSRQTMTAFERKVMPLAVDPLWLTWYDMAPQYIPLSVLHRLGASARVPEESGRYRTRLHIVLAEAVLPGLMALLASALSMLFLAYRVSAPAVVGIVFTGYIAHFGTKACLILGQNGYMHPLLAGWLVPGLLALAVAGVFGVIAAQRRSRYSFSAG